MFQYCIQNVPHPVEQIVGNPPLSQTATTQPGVRRPCRRRRSPPPPRRASSSSAPTDPPSSTTSGSTTSCPGTNQPLNLERTLRFYRVPLSSPAAGASRPSRRRRRRRRRRRPRRRCPPSPSRGSPPRRRQTRPSCSASRRRRRRRSCHRRRRRRGAGSSGRRWRRRPPPPRAWAAGLCPQVCCHLSVVTEALAGTQGQAENTALAGTKAFAHYTAIHVQTKQSIIEICISRRPEPVRHVRLPPFQHWSSNRPLKVRLNNFVPEFLLQCMFHGNLDTPRTRTARRRRRIDCGTRCRR